MKKKYIDKIINNKITLITSILAIAIISIIYKLNDVTPFGSKSLLCIDFYHQYGPMLAELYDKLKNGGNLIYSFNIGLGLPFFRNFLNYLSSPINALMLLFPRKYLITSYSFIIGLKAVLSATTMSYYLRKKFRDENLYIIALSLIYAFSSYFQAYYWNIMWLDGMIMIPLITLGIEELINTGKWKLYSISLAIMLLSNYFIGYMLCIYSVIYFILYTIYKTQFKKSEIKKAIKTIEKKCLLFGISSITAGCLVAFLLLPMANSMRSISATGGSLPTTQYYSFEFVDYLKAHLTGVKTTVFAADEITNPNISCGILSVALLFLFLINFEIPIKQKITYLLVLGFFIFAFFNPQLDCILQAFHVPNDLPYRYSFIYSFLLTVISMYSIKNIKKIKLPMLTISFFFLLVTLLYISKDEWPSITENTIYINMILLTTYFIFYVSCRYLKGYNKIFQSAIVVLACIDVVVSINTNWDITQVLETFYKDYKPTEELLHYVKKYDDDFFYRIENTNMMTLNDGAWYNYNGMNTFSSMAYESLAKLQHNLGMPGNEINSYYYTQSTPIYDMMFDMKYFIGNTNDTSRYTPIYTNEETVNEFNYNVGLAFGVNSELKNWNYQYANPFEMQNEFLKLSTGVENILEPSILVKQTELVRNDSTVIVKYQFNNDFDNLYFYTKDPLIDFILIGDCLYYTNDNYLTTAKLHDELQYMYLETYKEEKIINIYSQEDTVDIYIGYSIFQEGTFNVYEINDYNFKQAYESLYKNKIDITSFKNNKITGNISLNEDKTIYTSIPYDDGWEIEIDGKRVKAEKLADSLLIFDCPKGTHKIKIQYRIPLFRIGAIITTTTMLGIFLITKRKKYQK